MPPRRKGQPRGKGKAQPPPTTHVATEKTQEDAQQEDQEETRVVTRGPSPTPPRTDCRAKPIGTDVAAADSDSDDARYTDSSCVSNVSTVQEEGKNTRRSKVAVYDFSQEQEGELVEWYQSNPELYDKTHRHYRNRDRKNSLLDTKAKEIPGCTSKQLRLWFNSQRTRYGKLSQRGNKSGSGGKNVTQRQQWIMDKWGFIKSHIVRVERRQSTNKFDKESPFPSMSSDEEFQGTSGSTASTNTQHRKRSRITATSTAASTPSANEGDEGGTGHQELIRTLIQHATEAREARRAMTQPQTSHERAVDTFLGFLKTELLKMPENVWFNYTMDAMTMAHNYSQTTQQQMGHMVQQHMGNMGALQQMPLIGQPHQQLYQPQSLMPPPVMSSTLMDTPPMGRSPMASSTGQQQTYSQQMYSPPTPTSQQLATSSTYTVLQPAQSSSCSAVSPVLSDYISLDTPKPASVTPGSISTEAKDSSGELNWSLTGLMDTDHQSV